MSKKDPTQAYKRIAFKLQAEKEEERLAREKAQQIKEANIAWDDVHAKIKVDYQTELVEENLKKAKAEVMEGSSKRAGTELEQESIKKQKVDEDTETVELQSLMQVIPYEEEVAINAIPLATKPLTIVNWKIHKEGKYLLSNNVQGL
ncbi:hypothetical protein Tco_1524851 [Tanacetum coccineum]